MSLYSGNEISSIVFLHIYPPPIAQMSKSFSGRDKKIILKDTAKMLNSHILWWELWAKITKDGCSNIQGLEGHVFPEESIPFDILRDWFWCKACNTLFGTYVRMYIWTLTWKSINNTFGRWLWGNRSINGIHPSIPTCYWSQVLMFKC